MLLVDTRDISEARKRHHADHRVLHFLANPPGELFLAVQVIGELRQGAERIRTRGDVAQAKLLEDWLNGVIDQHRSRTIEFDMECAQVWGALMGRQPQNPIDKQMAAIALLHNLVVVTRNVDNLIGTGVETLKR